ncbi:MAG: ABC transporter substrate-binding protein [Planctomycetes bacterium]|nr:ABC transporter substrate-binding protein [Planctomycetota bacterium]
MINHKGKLALVVAAFAVGLGLSVWLQVVSTPGKVAGGAAPGSEPERQYRYRRIICMSPSVSEIVFAVGAGARVVGVSNYTTWPPEAAAKPKCGGFFDPGYERMLSLEPDLIIGQGIAADLKPFAQDNGIELVLLDLTDLESIFREIRRVGSVLEVPERAELVCARMNYRLAEVRVKAAGRPRVPVLLVTGREQGSLGSISTVGPGTFLDDLIEVAGGRNVFSDLPRGYAVINKETLLARAPEVIVELHGEGGDSEKALRRVRTLWAGLGTLPAVRQGRVYVITATYAMIPGPRVVEIADRLGDLLHRRPSDG